jgi:hypothetical protein
VWYSLKLYLNVGSLLLPLGRIAMNKRILIAPAMIALATGIGLGVSAEAASPSCTGSTAKRLDCLSAKVDALSADNASLKVLLGKTHLHSTTAPQNCLVVLDHTIPGSTGDYFPLVLAPCQPDGAYQNWSISN